MLRRSLVAVYPLLSATGNQCLITASSDRSLIRSSLTSPIRHNSGVSLLSPLAKLGQSRDLADDIKNGRSRNNKAIVSAFDQIQTFDEIHYRKTDQPWDLVPQYAKKRVTDLCGMLTSAHRMEIEQTIDRMQTICDVDLYVVLVPTVGYVTTKAFANSIMFNWGIGGVKGNGLLLLISQREATVNLSTSPAIEEYFDTQFIEPAVWEIFQPLVKEGDPSYATVQLVYAIARHAHEVRDLWKKGWLTVPTRNKVRCAVKTVHWAYVNASYLIIGTVAFIGFTVILINQILDSKCPSCGTWMSRVRDEKLMESMMTRGQYLEHKNACAHYRVWKCPKCPGQAVYVTSRDLHQSSKCLKCVECEYYTCNLTKSVERLPTKTEDGVKKMLYECQNCRIGREIFLPLYHPIDSKPEEEWYGFLLDRSAAHKPPPKGMHPSNNRII